MTAMEGFACWASSSTNLAGPDFSCAPAGSSWQAMASATTRRPRRGVSMRHLGEGNRNHAGARSTYSDGLSSDLPRAGEWSPNDRIPDRGTGTPPSAAHLLLHFVTTSVSRVTVRANDRTTTANESEQQ